MGSGRVRPRSRQQSWHGFPVSLGGGGFRLESLFSCTNWDLSRAFSFLKEFRSGPAALAASRAALVVWTRPSASLLFAGLYFLVNVLRGTLVHALNSSSQDVSQMNTPWF